MGVYVFRNNGFKQEKKMKKNLEEILMSNEPVEQKDLDQAINEHLKETCGKSSPDPLNLVAVVLILAAVVYGFIKVF